MEEKKKLIEEVFANLNEWHAEQKDLSVAWESAARRINNARKQFTELVCTTRLMNWILLT